MPVSHDEVMRTLTSAQRKRVKARANVLIEEETARRGQSARRKKKLKSPALQFTYDRYIKGRPEREASYEAELANAEVARKLYDLRTKAGLSQRELARLVGTTASVICRLEDADTLNKRIPQRELTNLYDL
jgi:ribosome-binding protein aMBF1 (putative translation factor)